MDGGLGGNTIPTNDSVKSKIFDVKPLRTLVPLFPEPPEGPPFVYVPPNGPFPSGFSPFFPFCGQQGSQSKPDLNQNYFNSTAVPLRSFRAESPASGNGNHKHKSAGPSSVKKKAKRRKDSEFVLTSLMNFNPGISLSERDDGNRELVESVLLRFDALRRKLSQMEDAKELHSGILKRADLKAANMMLTKGVRTNMKKRIGVVPGVEIGDIFFFRMELCLVGLHFPSMGGIDFMAVKGESEGERVALSIVASGGYDDDAEDPDVLVYSGQGGSASRGKEASDQQLVRGNLALERSFHRGNEVRVIRGLRDNVHQVSKVYVYDGLYKIQESWMEKGKSGCNMFKYKLVRIPGQPAAFATWKSTQKFKGLSSRVGLILPDLTSGAESTPVSLVNEVDDEKGPAYFTYSPTVKYSESFKLVQPSYACNCHDACQPGNSNCSCIGKNGGNFPYTSNGVLACRKSMIYECGPSCPCIRNCKNRVIQTGLKAHFEVFKTRDRGWGLRSWDRFRAGTFICEYAGEVIDETKARQERGDGENEYVFHTNRLYESFKWNFETESTEDFDIPSPFIISSKNSGNVARFMNHSCSPNVFWQPIMYESNNEAFLHIAFFAKKHIPPMTELTFDYGTPQSDIAEADNNPAYRKRKCLCGSAKCRGYFY
ncbi:hypothetical protein GQ457_07G019230 [Hibiscus cannabinus]